MIKINSFEMYAEVMREKLDGREMSKLIPICFLGLSEETGEVLEKIESLDWKGLLAEMGDVLWYMNAIRHILGLDFSICTDYQATDDHLLAGNKKNAIHLMSLAARIAGVGKKIIRDSEFEASDLQKKKVRDALSEMYSIISLMAGDLDTDTGSILQGNVDKLEGRKIRGTLHGSGDDR